jgi:hypothetical protein
MNAVTGWLRRVGGVNENQLHLVSGGAFPAGATVARNARTYGKPHTSVAV